MNSLTKPEVVYSIWRSIGNLDYEIKNFEARLHHLKQGFEVARANFQDFNYNSEMIKVLKNNDPTDKEIAPLLRLFNNQMGNVYKRFEMSEIACSFMLKMYGELKGNMAVLESFINNMATDTSLHDRKRDEQMIRSLEEEIEKLNGENKELRERLERKAEESNEKAKFPDLKKFVKEATNKKAEAESIDRQNNVAPSTSQPRVVRKPPKNRFSGKRDDVPAELDLEQLVKRVRRLIKKCGMPASKIVEKMKISVSYLGVLMRTATSWKNTSRMRKKKFAMLSKWMEQNEAKYLTKKKKSEVSKEPSVNKKV